MTGPSSFSESIGLVAPPSVIQKRGIDRPLRNRLWDLISTHYLHPASGLSEMRNSPDIDTYFHIYTEFWQDTADSVPSYVVSANNAVREWYFEAEWNEVYDFLTFVVRDCVPRGPGSGDRVVTQLNESL